MSDLKLLDPTFNITLTMKSDWHIGSGVGRPGDVDSLVRRDTEEMPFVPAKTLTGIWRDACETVAFGLDGGVENGIWQQLLDYIFGDQVRRENQAEENEPVDDKRLLVAPRRALLSVRAAHSPKELREAIRAKPYLKDAVTFVKPGISIHPRTGRTRTDFLRFEEMARTGAELTAACQLTLPEGVDDETRRAATALLVAGARFVERIGGKRRRGAGRCKIAITGYSEEIDAWLDWIAAHPAPALKLVESNGVAPEVKLEKRVSGDWVCLPLKITTLTPAIVPERTTGNLVKTLDHIPGTYLLPFITENLDVAGVDIRSAIAHGDLVVTNFTPEVSAQPGRPTPLNLSYIKLKGGLSKGKGVLNRFNEVGQGPQLKPQRGGYVGPNVVGGLPEYIKTKTSVETHNVVEDQSQRPTSDVGGVFSYQSINQEAALRGELRLRRSLLEELEGSDVDWRKRLSSEAYRIGRARKDDYGSVKIEFETSVETVKQLESPSEELRVWLLSDLLLRDERLRPMASIARFAQVLGGKLGVTLTLRETPKPDCKDGAPRVMDFAARPHRTDSWNTTWVLPRPSLVGLSAGSCFVFEIKKDAQFDATEFNNRLREVAANGLGERRAEGYGQMCFADQLLSASFAGIETSRGKSSGKEEAPRVASTPYAHLIETEGWRKEIRRRALSKASSIEGRKEALGVKLERDQSKPRMSQLGALRSVLGQLRNCQDAGKITDWIANLEKSKNRNDEWPQGSLKLIEVLITDQKRVWELLKDDRVSFAEITITQDGEIALTNELWAEAVRTLVDACVRAQKRDLEKLQQQAGNKPGRKGA